MNAPDLILFDNENSPCARRVRISLIEKGLTYRSREIDLSHLEQRSPSFLAINPNGLVPTLAHGGLVVWESNVITEYLDDAFPAVPLYPADPWARLEVKHWQAAEIAMAKDFRPLMYHRLMGPLLRSSQSLDEVLRSARTHTDDPVDLEWERRVWALEVLTPKDEVAFEARLYAFVATVEAALVGAHGWLVGDSLSQAEIAVYPRLAMYPMLGLTLDPIRWPNVAAWMRRIEARPSFIKTRSRSEASLASLAQSPVYRFLRRSLAMPEQRRGIARRIALRLIGRLVRRRMRQISAADAGPMPLVEQQTQPTSTKRIAAQINGPAVIRLSTALLGHPSRLVVQIALAETSLPWTEGGNDDALLTVDGQPISSVTVAIDLLDAIAHDGRSLLPSDAALAAQTRMWLAFDAGMFKEFQPLFDMHVRGLHGIRFDTDPERARLRLRQRLDQISKRLASRRWLVGEQFTIADAALATSLSFFPRLGVKWSETNPEIVEWYDRVLDRPAVASVLA